MYNGLCGWVSDKKFFTRSISGNKNTFFLALVSPIWISVLPLFICGKLGTSKIDCGDKI